MQIRSTLQGFTSVLDDMSQVCDTEQLQAHLLEADGQVADVQESFTAPLSQLEHAAAVSLQNRSRTAAAWPLRRMCLIVMSRRRSGSGCHRK